MSIWIELNEGTAARRRVPCRIFTSNGTTPDTGALADAVIMGVNSLTTISLTSTLRGVNSAHGMYCVELTASECSVLGTHPLYHTVGDFPQHIATVQVVNHNHFSTLSAISNVTIHAGTYSTVTVRIEGVDYSGLTIKGVTNYANISNVTLHAGTHSNVTIQGVTRLNSNVTLNANIHSGATIDGLSNKTFFQESVQSSVWSGKRSDWTTPGSFGEYAYSQVTGTSSGTVQGVTRALNLSTNGDKTGYTLSAAGLADFFDTDSGTVYASAVAGSVVKEIADNAGGSSLTEGGIARAVWANSGRTLDGDSTATVFVHPRSIWSTLRSDFTTPGSFGEYVYSQVTGTSTGTVKGVANYANISNVTLHAGTHSNVTIQGITRVLSLSANDDKTGYSISGTKTTLDALNDIDGSGVTLHAGTHSGATVQGVSNYANISNVTLHAGTHSNVTIQGVSRLNSGVTLNADTHSGATIAGIVAGGIINATLASGAISAAKLAAGTIDAAALATDAGQEIADRVLLRNIGSGSDGGRDLRSALYPLRNKSEIQGSVGTVYEVDDSTSAWTFSPSLGTAPLSGIDPLGP